MSSALSPSDWLDLFLHFLGLSLLAIGGAITTAPDMHRYLVDQQHWLSNSQFASSIALAQAAPGPNVLFIALLGWNVGINAAGASASLWVIYSFGLLGASITMLGIMLPSTTLTLFAARWGQRNKDLRAVQAFKQGMAPIAIALIAGTGWLLLLGQGAPREHWHLWLLAASVALLVWRTRIHLLWLLAGGALLGAMGWV